VHSSRDACNGKNVLPQGTRGPPVKEMKDIKKPARVTEEKPARCSRSLHGDEDQHRKILHPSGDHETCTVIKILATAKKSSRKGEEILPQGDETDQEACKG